MARGGRTYPPLNLDIKLGGLISTSCFSFLTRVRCTSEYWHEQREDNEHERQVNECTNGKTTLQQEIHKANAQAESEDTNRETQAPANDTARRSAQDKRRAAGGLVPAGMVSGGGDEVQSIAQVLPLPSGRVPELSAKRAERARAHALFRNAGLAIRPPWAGGFGVGAGLRTVPCTILTDCC